jgi:hypothetical protein
MELKALIDELQQLGEKGDGIWPFFKWPGNTIIESERFFELTDRIKAVLPEEVQTADEITRNRERILAEAHEERAKILNAAKEQAALLVSNDRVVREAEARAEEIIRQAQVEAQGVRDDADRYAQDVIDRLAGYTQRVLATVEKARQLMAERMSASEAAQGDIEKGAASEPG